MPLTSDSIDPVTQHPIPLQPHIDEVKEFLAVSDILFVNIFIVSKKTF
jgi:hypothetical protein